MAEQKLKKLFQIIFVGTKKHPIEEIEGVLTTLIPKVRAYENITQARTWARENEHTFLLPSETWLSKYHVVFDHAQMPDLFMIESDLDEFVRSDVKIHFQGTVLDFCEAFWCGNQYEFMTKRLNVTDPQKQVSFIWDLFQKQYSKKMFPKEKEHGASKVRECILEVIKTFVDGKTELAKSATP